MPRTTLYLVLLVSVAHALVHVYELGLPSVEQQIAAEFFGDDIAEGKAFSGRLSNAWRLMWGFGAVLAGLLVDRFGSRKLLTLYLIGCSLACAGAALSHGKLSLLSAMVVMGALASIYHPAGLALISRETKPPDRPWALGIHGLFGSAGIGGAPLLAGSLLVAGFDWRQVYWVLAIPGLALGMVFLFQAFRRPTARPGSQKEPGIEVDEEPANWRSYFTLTVIASMQGFVYSALMSFLPRYLSQVDLPGLSGGSHGTFLASGVLLMGCGGQLIAGRFARHTILEWQLTLVTLGNVPFLAWMAVAAGWDRAVAAGLLALVHFMHQPIYNSLIAHYTPLRRRSLCYGFSFAMGLGLGSFGAGFAGISPNDRFVYGSLAGVAMTSSALCAVLWRMNRETKAQPQTGGRP